MATKAFEHALDRLIELTERIALGEWTEVDQVLAMAGNTATPPRIAALAEASPYFDQVWIDQRCSRPEGAMPTQKAGPEPSSRWLGPE